MVGKNGSNYYGIKEVFGLEFMAFKVVSCQMHFKNDDNKASARFGAVSENSKKPIH